MPVLVFQCLVSGLLIAFGVVSLLVAARREVPAWYRMRWMQTGLAFLLIGLIKGVQNAFGSAAFVAGRGSLLWDTYLISAPVFDHSRTTALTVFFLLLLRGHSRSDCVPGSGYWRQDAVLLCTGAALGALLGWQQHLIGDILHYKVVSILDTAELVVTLSVLFTVLLRGSIDQILWSALSIHAVALALNGMWMSVLVGLRVPGAWAPSPLHMHLFRFILAAAFVGLALWRLVLARRNIDVSGFLEPSSAGSVPLLK